MSNDPDRWADQPGRFAQPDPESWKRITPEEVPPDLRRFYFRAEDFPEIHEPETVFRYDPEPPILVIYSVWAFLLVVASLLITGALLVYGIITAAGHLAG